MSLSCFYISHFYGDESFECYNTVHNSSITLFSFFLYLLFLPGADESSMRFQQQRVYPLICVSYTHLRKYCEVFSLKPNVETIKQATSN